MFLEVFVDFVTKIAVQWRPCILLDADDDGPKDKHVHGDKVVQLIYKIIISDPFAQVEIWHTSHDSLHSKSHGLATQSIKNMYI